MDSLDQEVLDRLGRDMGGDAAVTRILTMYVGKLPDELAALRELAGANDLAGLGGNAHRMKSSTAMLGATRLAGLLAELEGAAKAGDDDAAAGWLREIESEAPRVEEAMRARVG